LREYKELFRDLLDKAHILHEHFYEAHLSNEGFGERWGRSEAFSPRQSR
jgi:hypothetical protein